MDFRIADTFTGSLARLTGEEQKAVKTTAFDLQMDPSAPGLSFHRLDRAKDKNFWSVRVNADLRLIVHRSRESLLLCYVDHHDRAYAWAERRRLETHPATGAAQLVEIRERVQEVVVPVFVEEGRARPPARPLFAHLSDGVLLGYGLPPEWLPDAREATEDSLFELTAHLPAEAAEALLELATGGQPRAAPSLPPATSPFDHPDAQRRFRTIESLEELRRALEFPWERWTVFLHPEQRGLVERDHAGPARVSGSAGTGKTIVALHRAVFLARRHPKARVLLTTFSDTLASALRGRLGQLLGDEPGLGERLEVRALGDVGLRLFEAHGGAAQPAGRETVIGLLREAQGAVAGHAFGLPFLLDEWEHVVDAWQLTSWESYRDVARLGRKTRLPEAQRRALWAIFERVRSGLEARALATKAALFTGLAAALAGRPPVFDHVVVDEAQDLSVAHVRFLAALGAGRPNALFFAGDLGQRIFQQPFSWASLGVDVRGRSRTLRVNYRTSHQIRSRADRLLGAQLADVDGNAETRDGTVSVFDGPAPEVLVLGDEAQEIEAVAAWLERLARSGVSPHEFGVFVRSEAQLGRAQAAVHQASLPFKLIDQTVETAAGYAAVGVMHLAKGLEFRAVAAMACDDEVIPLQERVETVGDEADLQEVYDTERQLLYVACTRARDHLLVTGVNPASEFLDDLRAPPG